MAARTPRNSARIRSYELRSTLQSKVSSTSSGVAEFPPRPPSAKPSLLGRSRERTSAGKETSFAFLMGRGRRVEAILSEFPEPSATQLIVRVTGTPGSNLLRVEDASGSALVVRLPSKTRNTIWVRTGGYLIINASADVEEHGDVAHFLYKDQIRYLQNRGLWPAVFVTGGREAAGQGASQHDAGDSDDSGSDDDLMPNPNHRKSRSDSEDEDEDEEEDEEGDGGDVSVKLSQAQLEDQATEGADASVAGGST